MTHACHGFTTHTHTHTHTGMDFSYCLKSFNSLVSRSQAACCLFNSFSCSEPYMYHICNQATGFFTFSCRACCVRSRLLQHVCFEPANVFVTVLMIGWDSFIDEFVDESIKKNTYRIEENPKCDRTKNREHTINSDFFFYPNAQWMQDDPQSKGFVWKPSVDEKIIPHHQRRINKSTEKNSAHHE